MRRPIPQPSVVSEAFWAAARRHELVRPLCRACGRSFFTPQLACRHCLSEDWAYAESSGRGHIYSYTVCHRAPGPGFEVPYTLAIIDLEEEWSMLSNVRTPDPRGLAIGQAVQVGWLDLDEIVLPVFEPVAA